MISTILILAGCGGLITSAFYVHPAAGGFAFSAVCFVLGAALQKATRKEG